MNCIDTWTDGACKGNPGPGGWGAIILLDGRELKAYGGERNTTNNRMELMGAISALEAFKAPSLIRLHTDSQYVIKGINEWMPNWIKRGWKTASKQPVKNGDLWKRLDAARAKHQVQWVWVKGHAGLKYNEMADDLANKGCDSQAARPFEAF